MESRKSAVAFPTAVEVSSAKGASNIPDIPANVGFTDAVGIRDVVGFSAFVDFPACLRFCCCCSNKKSNILDYWTIAYRTTSAELVIYSAIYYWNIDYRNIHWETYRTIDFRIKIKLSHTALFSEPGKNY
jgi:hypothetical protein